MALRNRLAFLILASLVPAAGLAQADVLAGYLPVVGSLFGDFGSHFETSVQLVNPNFNGMFGRLVFHPAGQAEQPTDPSLSFHIPAGGSVSYEDAVAAMGRSGLGTMDVFWDGKDLKPVVVATIFNEVGSDQLGNQETHGCNESFVTFVPGIYPLTSVFGVLAGPIDVERFRFNIGVKVIGPFAMPVSISVRNALGDGVHSLTKVFPAGVFQQMSVKELLDGFEIGDNFSIEFRMSGPIIIYGATVDNRTNSPSLQIMPYVQVTG